MLLPELAQHQLLVARLDALHGALLTLPLCFASAALRSGRRARAREQRASGPASSGLPLVPRARARLQGREQQQQGVRPRLERRGLWEGLRAWVWVCSLNQVVCHGAWGGGRGGLWLRLWLGSWRGGQGRSRPRSWRSRSNIVRSCLLCLDRLLHRFVPSIYCPALVRPARQPSRYMQKLMLVPRGAEVAQSNRASQVDHVVLVGIGFHDVPHVVLVGIGFHDVPHALLADDLRDNVMAQRAVCVLAHVCLVVPEHACYIFHACSMQACSCLLPTCWENF